MRVIEIQENPNCDSVDMRVFNDLEPPLPVHQVRLELQPGSVQWYDVTGWTVDGTTCPAQAQKVDDSGDGVAFLLFGGDAGLRLRPAGSVTPWKLEDPEQRGESFLILGTLEDMKEGNG